MFMLVLSIGYVSAQGKADIKFDKTSHNFGTFSENDPVVSCYSHSPMWAMLRWLYIKP